MTLLAVLSRLRTNNLTGLGATLAVFLQARMEDHGECMLVLIGARPEGKKELIGFQVGVRESTQSWRELLIDVKRRGLQIAPEVAVGDGALGFWKALDEVFPGTRHQRCWVHKTVNESVFATVRHRTVRTNGSLSSTTARLMVFKLVIATSKTWRRLKGTNQLPKVIAGVRFNDGIEGHQHTGKPRRLMASSPKILHSSPISGPDVNERKTEMQFAI